jgi:hypothetical protein
MTMTHEAMDRAVNEHFSFEAADDLAGVMASLAGQVEHEIVPSPVGVQHDKASVHSYYARLFESVKGEGVTPLKPDVQDFPASGFPECLDHSA